MLVLFLLRLLGHLTGSMARILNPINDQIWSTWSLSGLRKTTFQKPDFYATEQQNYLALKTEGVASMVASSPSMHEASSLGVTKYATYLAE